MNKGAKMVNIQSKSGEESIHWKGDAVGYSALHAWLYRQKGKASKCSFEGMGCKGKSTTYQWANISHEYTRDVGDFLEMCRSCHAKYDVSDSQRERMKTMNLGISPPNVRTIQQFDKDGNFIKEYKAIGHAAAELNILRTSIQNVLAGRTKTAGGFQWR